jgi:hypothetical protein
MKQRRPKVASINVAVSQVIWTKFRSMASLRNLWARELLEELMGSAISTWEKTKGVNLDDLIDYESLQDGGSAPARSLPLAAKAKKAASKKKV